MSKNKIKPSLQNPLSEAEEVEFTIPGEVAGQSGPYEEVMKEGYDLIQRPSNQSLLARLKNSILSSG